MEVSTDWPDRSEVLSFAPDRVTSSTEDVVDIRRVVNNGDLSGTPLTSFCAAVSPILLERCDCSTSWASGLDMLESGAILDPVTDGERSGWAECVVESDGSTAVVTSVESWASSKASCGAL